MKIVIIGGTGHIGTFLVTRRITQGHEVMVVSRQYKPRYGSGDVWAKTNFISIDREPLEQSEPLSVLISAHCFDRFDLG